jgi:hypothetical protein
LPLPKIFFVYTTAISSLYSSCSEPLISPYMVKTANAVSLNLLPENSKERYIIKNF